MTAALSDLGGRVNPRSRPERPRLRLVPPRVLDMTPRPKTVPFRDPKHPRPDFGCSQRPPRCPTGWHLPPGTSGGRA